MAANLYFAQIEDLMFEVEKPLPNTNLFLNTHLLQIPRLHEGAKFGTDFLCMLFCSSQCGGALTS
jgi:hypothetical protein